MVPIQSGTIVRIGVVSIGIMVVVVSFGIIFLFYTVVVGLFLCLCLFINQLLLFQFFILLDFIRFSVFGVFLIYIKN
jgi:hypothetical protein